jgi:hypothetical protein
MPHLSFLSGTKLKMKFQAIPTCPSSNPSTSRSYITVPKLTLTKSILMYQLAPCTFPLIESEQGRKNINLINIPNPSAKNMTTIHGGTTSEDMQNMSIMKKHKYSYFEAKTTTLSEQSRKRCICRITYA